MKCQDTDLEALFNRAPLKVKPLVYEICDGRDLGERTLPEKERYGIGGMPPIIWTWSEDDHDVVQFGSGVIVQYARTDPDNLSPDVVGRWFVVRPNGIRIDVYDAIQDHLGDFRGALDREVGLLATLRWRKGEWKQIFPKK